MTAVSTVVPAGVIVYYAWHSTKLQPLLDAASKLAKSDAALAQQVTDTVATLDSKALWYVAVGLAWAIISACHGFYVAIQDDSEIDDRADPSHLRAPLLLLDRAIRKKRNLGSAGDDLKRFRATLYKPVKGMHIQCVPYVGWRRSGVENGGMGRSWPNNCGLVGKAIRRDGEREPLRSRMPESVQNEDQYYEALRDTWGYTTKDARAHAPMRLASLAVPITDGNEQGGLKVIGVVYCDSSDRDFFDEETVELCVLTAEAIADHVKFAASIGA